MKNKPCIYMADLTHDTIMISSETFPIGIGFVTAYAQKYLPECFDFKLFKMPKLLFSELDSRLPDILAMGTFPWNKCLGLWAAEYYKKLKPNGMVVFGGTFLPHEHDGQKNFFKEHPYVDLLVMYDGEYGFLEFLKRYLNGEGRKERILDGGSIDGCVYWSKEDNDVITGSIFSRPKDLDDIPSPYLTGLMDPFFDNEKMTPLIQSTRGCPFMCSYCWAGNEFNSKTLQFSIERITSELDYIAEKRKNGVNRLLIFADSNFGMYPKDEVIADKIASLQNLYNFPSSFSAPCGKNNKDRVIRMLKKIKNASPNIGIQSTDSQIQKNVSRKPIDLEEYKDIVTKIHKLGLKAQASIILGLPGESRETHLQTINDLIYMGIDEVSAFTFMFLEGTELSRKESQEKYGWYKNYRIVPRNVGEYGGKRCFEIETIGVGANSFSIDDYIYLRSFHGILTIAFNSFLFTEFISYLKYQSIDIFKFILSFFENLTEEPGPSGDQFRSYVREVKGELWESREELEAYFNDDDNYQKLLSGEVGDNLIQKYKILTVLDNFDAWCEYFYKQSLAHLKNMAPITDIINNELIDIKNHVLSKSNNILSLQNSNGEPCRVNLSHNVQQWKDDNYTQPLSSYKFEKSIEVSYLIKNENKRVVKEILELYSNNKVALLKVLSTRYYLPALFRTAR